MHGYRAILPPHHSPSHVPAHDTSIHHLKKKVHTRARTVKTLHVGSSQQLEDCFDHTNWDIFKHQDRGESTSTELGYIKRCDGTITVYRQIQVYPNQ